MQQKDNYIIIHENLRNAIIAAQNHYNVVNAISDFFKLARKAGIKEPMAVFGKMDRSGVLGSDWVRGESPAITKRNKFLKAAKLIKAKV